MAKKTKVVIVQAFDVVSPATVIETRLYTGGPVESTISIPESVSHYREKQILEFSRKADAHAFLAKHFGKAFILS